MFAPSSLSYALPFRLSGSALKIIAVVSMVIDHCAYFLMAHDAPLYGICRTLGRVAFPVFAFLIAEGFAHSRHRGRYFLTLLLCAVISEVPWLYLTGLDGSHNVMFTLVIGVATLGTFDRLREHSILSFLFVVGAIVGAWKFQSDYDWRGVLMIVLFYLLRFQTIRPWLSRNEIDHQKQALLQILFTFPLMAHYGLSGAILASIVIFLYDGTRGSIRGPLAKYSFYAFYPLHLTMLCLR